ncbi:MAG: Trk family potassium uptake protein [Clostridia bacterium]|nr:Trk family potassium uptake protein [Clostridia bacterium]
MPLEKTRWRGLSSFQIIILGFAGVILLGALLLMLPFSAQNGRVTPFNEALFTATSAACVTGLVVRDTASYWSSFGQTVILLLIQIGGLGVVSAAASIALLSGRRIGLMQRSTLQEAVAAPEVGGIVRHILFIYKLTFLIETVGIVCLLPVFCSRFGAKGIWMAVFTSISAFCNAGFDLMGTRAAPFQSLISFQASPALNIPVMLLIFFGGLGFLTWRDFCAHIFRFKRYRLQSKVVLVTTALLIVLPFLFFFWVDFSDLPVGRRILTALFQAITPRTAGFNTVDLNAMSGSGKGIMMLLMLIGGSPGSTAGGMKTTTLAVLLISSFSVFRRKADAEAFGRRIAPEVIKNAAAVLTLYFSLCFGGAVILSLAEHLPFTTCLFETASAVGTVGLTLGITPGLGVLSQTVLMLLMFFGRVGGLTMIYATFFRTVNNVSKLPQEKITVG